MITNNILAVINETPDAIMLSIAEKAKARRLEKEWTQQQMASRAGVTISSYRRFETKGEISLRSLTMIAFALDMTAEFYMLFSQKAYRTIDDVINESTSKTRKRGAKNG